MGSRDACNTTTAHDISDKICVSRQASSSSLLYNIYVKKLRVLHRISTHLQMIASKPSRKSVNTSKVLKRYMSSVCRIEYFQFLNRISGVKKKGVSREEGGGGQTKKFHWQSFKTLFLYLSVDTSERMTPGPSTSIDNYLIISVSRARKLVSKFSCNALSH